MEAGKMILHRRVVLASMLAGVGIALGAPAAAMELQYPELHDPAPTLRDPTRVFMVASARAGSRLLVGGEQGVIIYSDDAAASWRQASVPVTVTITSIAFATPMIGWATGGFGVILATQDGGASWVKQLDGIAEITMMNAATQSYVAAQPPGSDQADHANRRAQILTQEGPDKPFLCLLPISATEVFAFGSYRFAEYSGDGGKSWADWGMRIADPVSHNIYAAAAIGGAYYLVSETGLIFRSTDGGQSFPKLAQPGDATFFGICDAGAGGILAYGVAGGMFLSTDGGTTWNAPNFTGTANVNAVARIGTDALLAGDADGGLWVSRDNGHNFKLVVRNSLISVNGLQPIEGTRFLILSGIGIVPGDLAAMQG